MRCRYKNQQLEKVQRDNVAKIKEWERELGTLRTSNARLRIALEESHATVDEWRKQLTAWQDEAETLRAQVKRLETGRADTAAVSIGGFLQRGSHQN